MHCKFFEAQSHLSRILSEVHQSSRTLIYSLSTINLSMHEVRQDASCWRNGTDDYLQMPIQAVFYPQSHATLELLRGHPSQDFSTTITLILTFSRDKHKKKRVTFMTL